MKIISTIHIELTEIEQKTLHDASTILNELYEIIDKNDRTYIITDVMTNTVYDRYEVALASNVLQAFDSADKLEITK